MLQVLVPSVGAHGWICCGWRDVGGWWWWDGGVGKLMVYAVTSETFSSLSGG